MSKLHSVKVLGYEYIVKMSPLVDEGGMSQAGRTHVNKQWMVLDPTVSKQSQDSTVIHEIVEALSYHLELELSHTAIMGLECGIYQFIKDNPKFIRGILDK